MTDAQKAEADDDFRLRKSAESLAHYREAANQARRNLAEAEASATRAKEKHEALFHDCQKRAVARRKSGQIEVSSQY